MTLSIFKNYLLLVSSVLLTHQTIFAQSKTSQHITAKNKTTITQEIQPSPTSSQNDLPKEKELIPEESPTITDLPEEAKKVALDFLNALLINQPDLDFLNDLTCVSPYISEERTKDWLNFIQQFKTWLDHKEQNNFHQIKQSELHSFCLGDMGIWMIYVYDKEDLRSVEILPIALYKSSYEWKVTPFISNFDNTLLPHDHTLREQGENLIKLSTTYEREHMDTSSKIVESRLLNKFREVREQLKLPNQSAGDLVQAWCQAFKNKDIITMAALAQTRNSQPSSRFADAYAMIRKLNKSIGEENPADELDILTLLDAPHSGPGLVTLGQVSILNEKIYHAYRLNFNVVNTPLGLLISAPSYIPCLTTTGSNEFGISEIEDKEGKELAQTIIKKYLEQKAPTYATAEELAKEILKYLESPQTKLSQMALLTGKPQTNTPVSYTTLGELYTYNKTEFKKRQQQIKSLNIAENNPPITRQTALIDLPNETKLLLVLYSQSKNNKPQIISQHAFFIQRSPLNERTDQTSTWKEILPPSDINIQPYIDKFLEKVEKS